MDQQVSVCDQAQDETSERITYQVIDPMPILDTARFEQMMRVAKVMAGCTLIPKAIYMVKEGGDYVELPMRMIIANCFVVVNQSVRWGMDPFAVVQCVSVIDGKICYEGKLIAAVLDAKLGLKLVPEWDDKPGDAAGVEIFAYDENGKPVVNPRNGQALTVKGTVGAWKTTRAGSPWASTLNHRRQLMYRGSREWARLYRPAIMLGVYADDEIEEMSSANHSSRRESAPAHRAPPPPKREEPAQIEQKTELPMETIQDKPLQTEVEVVEEQQHRAPPPPRRAPDPQASWKAAWQLSFDMLLGDFRAAAEEAQTNEELGEAWDRIVEPEWRLLTDEQQETLLQVNRVRSGELPFDD